MGGHDGAVFRVGLRASVASTDTSQQEGHCTQIDGAFRTWACQNRDSPRGASVQSDRRSFRAIKKCGGTPPKQGGANLTEIRFSGLPRDNGVHAQIGHEYLTHQASQVVDKTVILRQQVRLFLE